MADGKVWWWEGVACVCMYATYVAFMAVNEKVMRAVDAFCEKKNRVGVLSANVVQPRDVEAAVANDSFARGNGVFLSRRRESEDEKDKVAIEDTVHAALEATVADLEREEDAYGRAVTESLGEESLARRCGC
jgi:hypothetical protein